MKDPNDKSTGDLLPQGKKRGRPVTGKALTPAQKQERYRNRQASQRIGAAVTLRRVADLLSIATTQREIEYCQGVLLTLAEQLDPQER